jgi:hypothetical protein
MIKVNVEYIIVNDKITKITPIVNKDSSSTLLEKMIAESVKVIMDDQIEKIIEPTNVKDILNNIGKT